MLHSFSKRPAKADDLRHPRRRSIQLSSLEERIVFNAELAVEVPSSTDAGGTANESPVLEANAGEQLAFEGAEGLGRFAKGGRGGDVYHVTNLEDGGEGSLRHGIESMTGPRTIVFDISGTIFLDSRLTVEKPYLTIAGQTAPGDGIAIANHTFQIHNTHDIIVRYIRVRAGDLDIASSSPDTHDTLAIRWSHDVILDHVSMSWSIDETLATYESENVTIQWSIISESFSDSFHSYGQHAYASLNWGGSLSLHHNLIAHHDFRMPKLIDISAEVVNNVFYDWGRSYPSNVGDTSGSPPSQVNFVNNLYLAGDSATPNFDTNIPFWGRDASEIWASGNLTDANHNGILDPVASDFSLHRTTASVFVASAFDFSGLVADSTLDAFELVLDSAGTSHARDAVDERVVLGVRQQGGGIINSQSDVGGFPDLQSEPAEIDSDRDGIPDAWERARDLDPSDGLDGSLDLDGDGVTNLEAYLNWLLQQEPLFALIKSTEVSDQGTEFSFSVESVLQNANATFEYQVDWNGDGVVDQSVFAQLGTPIGHQFKNGTFPVHVTVLGEGDAKFSFSEIVDAGQDTMVDMPVAETESKATIVVGDEPLKEGDLVTIELDGPKSEGIGIDWNGDGRIDQTTTGADFVQHVYGQAGVFEIFVFASNGDLFASHSITVEEDTTDTLVVSPPVASGSIWGEFSKSSVD